MFFYASKIFWALAQPISIMMLLAAASLVFGILRWRRTALTLQAGLVIIIVLAGFTSIGAMLIQPLENRFDRPEPPQTVSAIIVLGGSTLGRIGSARNVTELNTAGDRMTAAVALSRRYQDAPIVFSGGIGTIIADGETEAASAKRFFLEQGIPASRLVMEDQARNTEENAALTAELLDVADAPALLVTSAFHMPRSIGLFRKAGVDVVGWPVDYRSTGRQGFELDIANPVLNIEILTVALREWIGLAAYRLTGRIDDVLPAQ
jgi:uncharacterized SAM-binding protein YcdF (DUF218 family)